MTRTGRKQKYLNQHPISESQPSTSRFPSQPKYLSLPRQKDDSKNGCRLLSTMLFNLVAFMVMMQMPKAEIKKKVVVQICNVTFTVRSMFVKYILVML